jgi:predicted GNAT superfamily acetyltransferase
VPIPAKFQTLKKNSIETAIDWRMKTLKIFQTLLAQGFVGVDFIRDDEGFVSYYLFIKKDRLSIEERSCLHG